MKLRYRDTSLITGKTLLSVIFLVIIARITILLHFHLYRIHDKDDEYYYSKTMASVFEYQK